MSSSASRVGVGWSNSRVAGRRSPVAAAEAVAQLDRRRRVEAELLERPPRLDGVGRGMPEHERGLAEDEVQHGLAALALGHRGDAIGERQLRVRGGRLGLVRDRNLRCRRDGRRHIGRHLGPVALALERVGRQAHPPGLRAREQRLPVDPHPAHVRLGERGEEALGAALVAAQRRDRGDPVGLAEDRFGGLLGAEGQDRMGADLDEAPVPVAEQRLDRAGVLDGLAQVAIPVLGVHRLGGRRAAAHRRVQGDVARRAARSRASSASISSRRTSTCGE